MLDRRYFEATIAAAQSVSGIIDTEDFSPCLIITPAALTCTQFTFQVSIGGGVFVDWYDDLGNEIIVEVGASRAVRLDPVEWLGFKAIKIRAGTSAVPVAEAGGRIIEMVARPV